MDCGHRPVGGGAHARGVRGEARPRLCARAGASPSPARISHMLNLREYRSTADRHADHLPWAALIAPGVALNKEGSFQTTLRFCGPDLESATHAEMVASCAGANNCLDRKHAWLGNRVTYRCNLGRR